MITKLTKEQQEYINSNKNNLTISQIAKDLNVDRRRVSSFIHCPADQLEQIFQLSDKQRKFIIDNYAKMTQQQIADELGLSKMQIIYCAKKLNLKKAKTKTPNIWTNEQLQYLKDDYCYESRRLLAIHTGQSENNIRNKLIELGLVTKQQRKVVTQPGGWTKDDIQYLKDNYEYGNTYDIATHLNKSYQAILNKATRLGLQRKVIMYTADDAWADDELQCLITYYPIGDLYTVMTKIHRTYNAIIHKATRLNLSINVPGTIPEVLVNSMLQHMGIVFMREQKLIDSRYRADFVVGKIVFEVQGDYYHANQERVIQLQEWQKQRIQIDKQKKYALENADYVLYYIWENDLKTRLDYCYSMIYDCLFE